MKTKAKTKALGGTTAFEQSTNNRLKKRKSNNSSNTSPLKKRDPLPLGDVGEERHKIGLRNFHKNGGSIKSKSKKK